jgi:diguanylate cyclase (GGDEF)-like protein/PAS domain S-box-containing protein
VVEHASDVLAVVEDDGTIRHVSPAVERVLGYRPEDLVGKAPSKHTHPDDLESVRRSFAEARETPGIASPVRFRVRAADGSWRHVEVVRNNLLDDPNVRGFVTSTRDVTERVRAEEQVRLQARLLDAVGQAVIATDVDGKVVYWNRAAEHTYGWTAEEAGGQRLSELAVAEDLRDEAEEIRAVLGTGKTWSGEFLVRRKDGSSFPALGTATPVIDGRGNVAGMIGVSTDITERVRTEEALKDSEERYRGQSRELALLYQASTALAQELELPAVFRTVVEAIAKTYGYTQVSAYLLEGEELVLQHQVGYHRVIERIPVTRGVSGRAVRTGLPVLVEDVRTSPDFLGAIEGIVSEICVPLFDGGEVVGQLNVESTGGVKLTQEDLRSMVAVGEQASVAISRARLHTRVRKSENRFRSLVQNSSDIVSVVGADRTVRYVSPAIERVLGYRPEERAGASALELVHSDDLAKVEGALLESLRNSGGPVTTEMRMRHKDGTWRHVEATVTNRLNDPAVEATVVNWRDVTEPKRAGERLREAEQRYRTLIERMPAVVYVQEIGSPDSAIYMSPQIGTLTGYSPEECKDPDLRFRMVHPDDRERIRSEDERTGEPGEVFTTEYRVVHRDGRIIWVRNEAVVVAGEASGSRYWQGFMVDITERKRMEEQLQQQALRDPLTGLPNRQLLVDHLGRALERTGRKRRKAAVLFMDLDGFKVVNDSLGHEAGDLLLAAVAERLQRCLRPEDTLARLGGDEFVALLQDVGAPDEAIRVARRIADELRSPFSIEERELFVTTSIGVALGTARATSPEDLLRAADIAMYRAKEEGVAYRMFDPEMHKWAVRRLEVENDVRRAVEAGEFVVHYQPIVDLETGEMWGLEALLRWDHPERGLLKPWAFMPVLEETGLVVPVGERVLEEACRQARAWQDDPRVPPSMLAVNLSAVQLQRSDVARSVERTLRKTGLEARRLSLDVTETAYISVLEDKTVALERLKRLGVRLAIDDFGVGYSSLSYLKRLPADFLKIDRSFVRGLGEDVEDTAIVGMVIDLAHVLGMKVVAEGVESAQHEEQLKEMGCDLAQGFYFAGAQPGGEIEALLASGSVG